MTSEREETPDAQTDPAAGEQGGTAPEGVEVSGETSPEAASTAESEPGVDRQQRRDERWRERATAAEARVERLVRGEVIRQLAGRVSDPEAALRLGETNVGDLLDDAGNVDLREVEALARGLVAQYPSLQPRAHHGDIGQKSVSQQGKSVSWADVMRKK